MMTTNNELVALEEKHNRTDTLEEHVESPSFAAPDTSQEAHVTLKTWTVISVGQQ